VSDRALRLADRRAREAAQTVFDRPLALIAGAGTGKTSTLVARIVAWCSGPGWERARKQVPELAGVAPRVLQRVVAITFTEAAAAEMAERLSVAFSKLSRGELPEGVLEHALPEPELLRPRARALLESLDQLGVEAASGPFALHRAARPYEKHVFARDFESFALQVLQRPDEKAGADQENERRGDLEDDESVAQARAQTARRHGQILQSADEVRLRRQERRHDAEQRSRHHGDQECEAEDAPIEAGVKACGKPGGQEQ